MTEQKERLVADIWRLLGKLTDGPVIARLEELSLDQLILIAVALRTALFVSRQKPS